ncbi:hypothetical protein QYM36_002614, partial [Artemia franciscana]
MESTMGTLYNTTDALPHMSTSPSDRFPRTLSTSVLRIKHRSIFWEKFLESRASTPNRYGEDLIVTPFAQILATLRNIRNNYISLTNVTPARNKRSSSTTGPQSFMPKNNLQYG